jgi:hypothetical protein
VAIISIAQQEMPIGIGQREFLRAQLVALSTVVVRTSTPKPWDCGSGLLLMLPPRVGYGGAPRYSGREDNSTRE